MVAKRDVAAKSKGEAAKENRDALSAMADVASGFKLAKPALEVVRHVRAVPTILPDLDRALRIGGWPIGNVSLIHGPSAEGKTPALIALMRSFLAGGHFALWGDFERSTPKDWLCSLMGDAFMREDWSHPGFAAVPPDVFTYEKQRHLHRDWAESIANARERGKLPPGTSGIYCVDSIKKLMPAKAWETLSKAFSEEASKKKGRFAKGDGGMDGMNGALGRMKAAFNAMWMDELVPLLTATQTSVAIITRETTDAEAEAWELQYKLGGGVALQYESHLWLRVTSDLIFADDDPKAQIVGEAHEIHVRRSKVGVKTSKRDSATFHTSNGLDPASPKGFDLARDIVTAAIELDVMKVNGSWFQFDGESVGQGRPVALSWVRQNLEQAERVVRAKITENAARAS